MSSSQKVFALCETHKDQEQLILLAALSILWLEPQNPEAEILLKKYQEKNFSKDALRETALQLSILAGFQTSLEAFFQIQDVYGEKLPELKHELESLNAELLLKRGEQLQAEVYRDNVEKLRVNLLALSPELASWTVLMGYGVVMAREGLPAYWRELFEVAVLGALGFPRQLHSHFRGSLNLGASPQEVELVLKVIEACSPSDKSDKAWQMWRRIKK